MNKTNDLERMEYTQARMELDEILKALEEGKVDIDQLALKVERASALIKHCRDRLEAQEAKVNKITAELSGEEEEEEE